MYVCSQSSERCSEAINQFGDSLETRWQGVVEVGHYVLCDVTEACTASAHLAHRGLQSGGLYRPTKLSLSQVHSGNSYNNTHTRFVVLCDWETKTGAFNFQPFCQLRNFACAICSLGGCDTTKACYSHFSVLHELLANNQRQPAAQAAQGEA